MANAPPCPITWYNALEKNFNPLAMIKASAPIKIGFLANFDWWPNKDGLNWFLDSVYPSIRKDIELHLFGNGSEKNRLIQNNW